MKATTIVLLSMLSGACTSTAEPSPELLAEVAAFQTAVRAELARTDAELFTPGLLYELPPDWKLWDLDIQGCTGTGVGESHGEVQSAFVVYDGQALRAIAWNDGFPVPDPRDGQLHRIVDRNPVDGAFLVAAGTWLGGFDEVLRLAIDPEVGVTLVAERDGAPWLIAGDRVLPADFDPDYPPTLSLDGRRICFVRSGLFSRRGYVAPVDDLDAAVELDAPVRLDWPVVLDGDGAHWAAKATDGARQAVVLDGPVIGWFDRVIGPSLKGARSAPVWKVEDGGQQALVIGAERTPWFATVAWPERSADGAVVAYVGSDATGSHLLVDGERVLTHARVVGFGLAPSGRAWAAAVRDADGLHVVHGERRHGPLPPTESYVHLVVDEEHVLTIFDEFDQEGAHHLFLDGTEIGAGFARTEEPQLVPGGGYVFVGLEDGDEWLVTPAERSGPWDWIGGRRIAADGARVAFVAGRGREVRRVVAAIR